jgi:hypothetical protein
MCAIIDANCAGDLMKAPPTKKAKVLIEWLRKKGHLAVGGKLAAELARTPLAVLLLELDKVRRLAKYPHASLEMAEAGLKTKCISNDSHIIALALISGARVLVSEDQDLWNDFRNPQVLQPAGRIYRHERHKHLLDACGPCRRPQ